MKLDNTPWIPGRRLIDHRDLPDNTPGGMLISTITSRLCASQAIADRAIRMMLSSGFKPVPKTWHCRSPAAPTLGPIQGPILGPINLGLKIETSPHAPLAKVALPPRLCDMHGFPHGTVLVECLPHEPAQFAVVNQVGMQYRMRREA